MSRPGSRTGDRRPPQEASPGRANGTRAHRRPPPGIPGDGLRRVRGGSPTSAPDGFYLVGVVEAGGLGVGDAGGVVAAVEGVGLGDGVGAVTFGIAALNGMPASSRQAGR